MSVAITLTEREALALVGNPGIPRSVADKILAGGPPHEHERCEECRSASLSLELGCACRLGPDCPRPGKC